MPTKYLDQIHKSRLLLGNQYAHLNDNGEFDAVFNQTGVGNTITALSRKKYQNQYAHLNDIGEFDNTPILDKASPSTPTLSRFISVAKIPGKRSINRIEQLAREIQIEIWKYRQQLWPDEVPTDPVDLLDPSIALKAIGFNYSLSDSLGYFPDRGTGTKVAGYIDKSNKKVRISRHLPYETWRFTAAHELGHAILHNNVRMHRDRAVDGSGTNTGRRNRVEVEADKFASVFLMPRKLMQTRFKQIYGCDVFSLDHETAFALDPSGSLNLNDGNITRRDLARILAKAERFNTRNIIPLFEQFRVSVEAMAIRIEELNLIEV